MADGRMTPAGRKAAEAATSGTKYIGADKSDEDIAKAGDTAKLTDTTRIGAKKEAGFPNRKDFKNDPDYFAAIASFRNKQRGQLEALKK